MFVLFWIRVIFQYDVHFNYFGVLDKVIGAASGLKTPHFVYIQLNLMNKGTRQSFREVIVIIQFLDLNNQLVENLVWRDVILENSK